MALFDSSYPSHENATAKVERLSAANGHTAV